jgi:DNA-directed RNA polymerase III subunit RPC11
VIGEFNGNEFVCQACPFVHKVTLIKSPKKLFKRKQVDDILGSRDQWENVDSTSIECPKCGHMRAFFMQIQIRSADEPSTLFYKVISF